MNATNSISFIRRALDDEAPAVNSRKGGVFWSDELILAVLNASQWSVVRLLAARDRSFLLSKLLTYTEGNTIPDNYAFAVAGQITVAGRLRRARLTIGGTGVVMSGVPHAAVSVEGTAIRYVGGAGRLWYFKKPGIFTTDSASADYARVDFDRRVYDAIENHAAAILGMKDGLSARYAKRFGDALRLLLKESPRNFIPEGLV